MNEVIHISSIHKLKLRGRIANILNKRNLNQIPPTPQQSSYLWEDSFRESCGEEALSLLLICEGLRRAEVTGNGGYMADAGNYKVRGAQDKCR